MATSDIDGSSVALSVYNGSCSGSGHFGRYDDLRYSILSGRLINSEIKLQKPFLAHSPFGCNMEVLTALAGRDPLACESIQSPL